MYLCYMDESGTPEIPGNTSHFVLAGLSIPIAYWRECDGEIKSIKKKYRIENTEIHTAWMLRPYREQRVIANFSDLDFRERVYQVESFRKADLLRLQRVNPKQYKQTRKNYQQTASYIHLDYPERQNLIHEIAERVAGWKFARLFAECVDKIHFDPYRNRKTIDEQSFEQIVSRFEQYLQVTGRNNPNASFGLIIHDNNQTVAKKHTELMKKFHQDGTLWINIKNIIETPLFVDSHLTSMVQIADLCGYSLRRYLENNEDQLFNLIFQRADRKDGTVVGVRHFTGRDCACRICMAHRKPANP